MEYGLVFLSHSVFLKYKLSIMAHKKGNGLVLNPTQSGFSLAG
jgi:hypothetical protein